MSTGLNVTIALVVIGLVSTAAPAQPAQADPRAAQAVLVKQVKEHIDKAKAAAGKEWPWFQQLIAT